MIGMKFKKKLPINTLMMICYCLLMLYAYIQTDRIINNLCILVTVVGVIDGVYFFSMIRHVDVKLKVDDMVQKNEAFSLRIHLRNNTPLPVAYIDLVPKEGKRCKLKTVSMIESILQGREDVEYSIWYNANLCGLEALSLEKVIYKSFFSFFKKEVEVKEIAYIKILPSVMPLREMESFTQFIGKFSMEEGRQVEASITIAGEEELGYELRPYVMGDSQKLIHWKIAAYKGELLVRQREKEDDRRKDLFFILNPFLSVGEDEGLIVQDKLLTSFISLVGHYVNQGERVRIAYYCAKSWQYIKVKNSTELKQLQQVLGAYVFLNTEEITNQKNILKSIVHITKKKAGIKILVSNYWTHELEEYILGRKEIGVMPLIWTGNRMLTGLNQQSDLPVWHMTDDYIMESSLDVAVDMKMEKR